MNNGAQSAFLAALQSVGVTPQVDDEEKLAEAGALGVTAENFWRHPDAHPVALDYQLVKKYGTDWLEWEAETIEAQIPQDFKTQTLSDLNMAKIQACKTLHLVDSFWDRWEVFVWCTMAFNGVFPDFEIMQVPTVAQCLVAAGVASALRKDIHFSQEVKAYLDTLHRHEGVLVALPPLEDVAVDTHEIHVNLEDIKKRLPRVLSSGKAPDGDTMEDEQLRRLLISNQYLEESRTRLRHQLRLLSHA